MSGMDCIKKAASETGHNIIKGKLKLTKMVKPMLKFLKRRSKTNAVTPSTCNYDVIESAQNDLNESELFQLHFRFYEEKRPDESDENARNEELENRLKERAAEKDVASYGICRLVDGKVIVERISSGTYLAVPVHFIEDRNGEFTWAPLPDRDISRWEDDSPICEHQSPEQQVPVLVSTAA